MRAALDLLLQRSLGEKSNARFLKLKKRINEGKRNGKKTYEMEGV